MKKVVNVTEVDGEGLEALLGESVLLLCANYIYAGTLTGVNKDFVQLTSPSIVYETGAWNVKDYQDVQKLHTDILYVMVSAIESFGKGK